MNWDSLLRKTLFLLVLAIILFISIATVSSTTQLHQFFFSNDLVLLAHEFSANGTGLIQFSTTEPNSFTIYHANFTQMENFTLSGDLSFEIAIQGDTHQSFLVSNKTLNERSYSILYTVDKRQKTPINVSIMYKNVQIQGSPWKVKPVPKLLLIYTSFFGKKPFDVHNFSTCEYYCDYTFERAELNRADAVVFHAYDTAGVPSTRPNFDQIWIWWTMESPHNTPSGSKVSDRFNWTMTYRLDSDVTCRYGSSANLLNKFYLSDKNNSNFFLDIMAKKKNLVMAAISNCSPRGRLDYINQLSKYIPVDVYGSCGKLRCRKGSKECDEKFQSYKFNLAFENSLCPDYVTEKFWNTYKNSVVPIVRAFGNHSNHAPNSSFISIGDFSSTEDLAKYLLHLNQSDDAYHGYFQWREAGRQLPSRPPPTENPWCAMCRKLTTGDYVHKSVNVKEFFNPKQCISERL